MVKRMHTRRRESQGAAAAGAIVYRFPIIMVAGARTPAGGTAQVYWSRTRKVELYPFDAAYLARLRAHDPETEGHFVAYFNTLLKAKLRSQGYFDSPMNDIRQETLYRVLKAVYAGSIHNPVSLHSYVLGVCANVVLEYGRGQRRFAQEDSEEFPEIVDDRNPADGAARQAEMRDAVCWVLKQLNDKERRILSAVFLQERDKDKICEEFGIDRDYLRVLIHRALANAKKLFDKGASS
jgi:RNA polymerase sigma-70 factor (ECF subfamily)